MPDVAWKALASAPLPHKERILAHVTLGRGGNHRWTPGRRRKHRLPSPWKAKTSAQRGGTQNEEKKGMQKKREAEVLTAHSGLGDT